jgi:hypothetical protein
MKQTLWTMRNMLNSYIQNTSLQFLKKAELFNYHHALKDYANQLTIWNRVLLEKLTDSQLVKKIPVHGILKFVPVFPRVSHWSACNFTSRQYKSRLGKCDPKGGCSFVRDITFECDAMVIVKSSFAKHMESASPYKHAKLNPKLNNAPKVMRN